MTIPEFRAYVDRLLLESNIGLAFAPQLNGPGRAASYAIGPSVAQPAPARSMDRSDGSLQVALWPAEKMIVQSMMRASGADKGLDRTLGRMTGNEFKPDEIKVLEDRALTAAKWRDVGQLKGIGEGPPVILNTQQRATVDGLMGQLGSDSLASRARAAYGRAVSGGQIRVR